MTHSWNGPFRWSCWAWEWPGADRRIRVTRQQKNVVVAQKVAAAPALDGTLDAAGRKAQPLTVRAVGGKNLHGGSTRRVDPGRLRGRQHYSSCSSRTRRTSVRRSPWQKQAEGSVEMLKDPDTRAGTTISTTKTSGDYLEHQLPAFEQRGCSRPVIPARDALRQQVPAQHGREGRHLAHDGCAQRHRRPGRRPRPRQHKTTRTRRPKPAGKSDPKNRRRLRRQP